MKKALPLLSLLVSTPLFGQNPLAIPPLVTADTFHLHVAPSTAEFYPGVVTNTYGINAPYLGATLELQY
ncbi:MAG: hypothetical protein KDB93_07590, partial [Flavobacteriales bacterium]|nr:hypothetical protein [Flavobacteriales bacterium]